MGYLLDNVRSTVEALGRTAPRGGYITIDQELDAARQSIGTSFTFDGERASPPPTCLDGHASLDSGKHSATVTDQGTKTKKNGPTLAPCMLRNDVAVGGHTVRHRSCTREPETNRAAAGSSHGSHATKYTAQTMEAYPSLTSNANSHFRGQTKRLLEDSKNNQKPYLAQVHHAP